MRRIGRTKTPTRRFRRTGSRSALAQLSAFASSEALPQADSIVLAFEWEQWFVQGHLGDALQQIRRAIDGPDLLGRQEGDAEIQHRDREAASPARRARAIRQPLHRATHNRREPCRYGTFPVRTSSTCSLMSVRHQADVTCLQRLESRSTSTSHTSPQLVPLISAPHCGHRVSHSWPGRNRSTARDAVGPAPGTISDSLDPDHHRVRSDQRLDARGRESSLPHPA